MAVPQKDVKRKKKSPKDALCDIKKKQCQNCNKQDECVKNNAIAQCIDKYVSSIFDIKCGCAIFVSNAAKFHKQILESVVKDLDEAKILLKNPGAAERVRGIKFYTRAMRQSEKVSNSELINIGKKAFFLSLFSSFDAFTGGFLFQLYEKRPELYNIIDKKYALSEIIEHTSIDRIKSHALRAEIEGLRRKSYIEQFDWIKSKFDISLNNFSSWPKFIECSQRRNLYTHCDGVVSSQYIKVCGDAGFEIQEGAEVGTKLPISMKYFDDSCLLMREVGFKMGQTLWRKILKSDNALADQHLVDSSYQFLQHQDWDFVKIICKFACEEYIKVSNDVHKTIILINYATAEKFSNNFDKALSILGRIDFSAKMYDFKLANCILRDDYKQAVAIMKKIGKKGELVSEQSYNEWPLLREFRETEEFLGAYQEIYGYPFVKSLERSMKLTKEETTKELKKGDKKSMK